MKKLYFLFFFLLCSIAALAQVDDDQTATQNKQLQQKEIEGFKMYPNPVANGILSIYTNDNAMKSVEIFDVLGKRVLAKRMTNRQISVANLKAGVYILKVTENNKTATRKLVIK